MAERFTAYTTKWVLEGGAWLPAGSTVDVVHYTNATVFVNNGRVIDGRKTGLLDEDFKALMAKYPADVVDLKNGEFTLPFVPVGTMIDITPETIPAAPPGGGGAKPAP